MAQPDLSTLAAFLAVARTRNFRTAAAERGVSASTLSATVKALEEQLGVRLFHRTTRSVTPTAAGEALMARLGPAMGEVSAALTALDAFRAGPRGVLRLNVPSAAAKLVLAPLVAAFLTEHPGVTLDLVEDNALVDVFAAGFDAGVRYGERLAQDVIAVPLGPAQRYVVVGAPAHVARLGAPAHPRDLIGRPLIRYRFPSGAMLHWEFERDGESLTIVPDGPLIVSSAEVAIRVARDGLGLFFTMDGFVEAAIARGELVEVLADWSLRFPGPWLYYASRRQVPPPLAAFVAFLRHRNAMAAASVTAGGVPAAG